MRIRWTDDSKLPIGLNMFVYVYPHWWSGELSRIHTICAPLPPLAQCVCVRYRLTWPFSFFLFGWLGVDGSSALELTLACWTERERERPYLLTYLSLNCSAEYLQICLIFGPKQTSTRLDQECLWRTPFGLASREARTELAADANSRSASNHQLPASFLFAFLKSLPFSLTHMHTHAMLESDPSLEMR